ncbi:MAG: hypothetical protein ACRD2G_14820 [Terriglobia bacterium]
METSLHADNQPVVEAAEIRRQLKKILRSTAFRNAPGLKKFLEYVVGKTTEGLANEIKEYSIAVEVLGKPDDYDPRLDTTVRVQAHRLREKLEEYYNAEGLVDEIVIELPKGHYIPQFSRRSRPLATDGTNGVSGSPQNEPSENTPVLVTSPPPVARPRLPAAAPRAPGALLPTWLGRGAIAVLLFVAGALVSPMVRRISFFGSYERAHGGPAKPAAAGPIQTVWANFWKDSSAAIVAYSNSMFLVTETSDLLRLKAGDVDGLGAPAEGGEALSLAENPRLVEDAGPVFFNDGYTGTGEVMAVYYLDRLFARSKLNLTVERSQLVTTGDLRNQNVIFLGSVIENPMLSGLPLNENFVFEQPRRAPTLWRARIVNLHPRAGEAASYGIERDPKTQVLLADYALISFLPGVASGREIAILAGLTTIGTQAAAQFITSPSGASELIAHLGSPHSSAKTFPRYFQALLRVEIRKDEILKVQYVAGRSIHPPG